MRAKLLFKANTPVLWKGVHWKRYKLTILHMLQIAFEQANFEKKKKRVGSDERYEPRNLTTWMITVSQDLFSLG